MTTIALDIPTFRALYPQFADADAFPDAALNLQYGLACDYVSADTYGDMSIAARTNALMLMLAHLLALGVIIAKGNYQGQPGVVTASSVGDVSVTLQPPPQRDQWRWWLNCTPYGAQLVALLDVQSAGGFFVGGLPERSAFRKVGGVF